MTWHTDELYVETGTKLSLADRLRILLGGTLQVRSRTLCEHAPGHVGTDEVTAWVDWWGRRLWHRIR